MSKWSVVIADDEPAARRGVRQLLGPFAEFAVVNECRNGAEVLASLDADRPHVVFLDIQMPGIDGFEVIRRRSPERMPIVVFLTAYDQFAIRAFEVEAFDYLVKPVSEARFAATMKRVVRQLGRSTGAARDAAIVVPTARGSTVLPVRDIDWIEAADNYSRIWMGARSYLLREPLRVLENRVRPHGFVRAHRRALVPVGAIRELKWTDGELVVVLSNGVEIQVSRRRRAAIAAAVRATRL
jgi:two-component system, LytTR family, response regulator